MTDNLAARIEELKALEAKATKGPWRARYTYRRDAPGTLVAATAVGHQVVMDSGGGTHPSQNLQLIVAMRNALPDLLAAAEDRERMQRTNLGLVSALKDMENSRDRWKDLACSAPDAFSVQYEHSPHWMAKWDVCNAEDEAVTKEPR